MQAAVLRSSPADLEIVEVSIDGPGPREVLIRNAAAGLCHSDLHVMEGNFSHPTPAVLGHESAGIVEQVGADVSYVQPGDRVITCLSVFCGHCEYCTNGQLVNCRQKNVDCFRTDTEPPRLAMDGAPVHQGFSLGSFAEKMLVHEHAVVKIRPEIPLDRAALIGCAVTTGLGSVFRTARVEPGSTVAVIGCGGVGLSAVQGARIAGAGRVIAVDVVDSKLDLARRLGATDTINAQNADPVAEVRKLTNGGAHYSFEAIGLKETAEQSFHMIRRGGTATLIGLIAEGTMVELPGLDFSVEKKIQGSNMGSNQFRVDMPRFVDMYLDGRLLLDEMISARIGLDEVNDGFEAMKTGEVARSVITFE